MDVEYRRADMSDLTTIVAFVDYWLTGGGKAVGIPGAGHDFFVPAGRHEKYLAKYAVLLAMYGGEIVGWAVKTQKGVLIHLLIAATFRGQGIGSELLRRLHPDAVRSKFDQSSGDPSGFYHKHGYVKAGGGRVGKKKNIEIFTRPGVGEGGGVRSQAEGGDVVSAAAGDVGGVRRKKGRSIDVVAERLALVNFSRRRF